MMTMLMKNSEFSTFFYFKTSSRVYVMYKKMLMSNLFSQCELVSYYVLENSCSSKFIYKSIYDICDNLNISRRSLYNILNKFESEGIIEKLDDGPYKIINEKYLKDKSDRVKRFSENNY
jgi:GTP-sensing pleiotropic transcriptional regulator CodY